MRLALASVWKHLLCFVMCVYMCKCVFTCVHVGLALCRFVHLCVSRNGNSKQLSVCLVCIQSTERLLCEVCMFSLLPLKV